MKRFLGGLVAGCLIGATVTLTMLTLSGGLYEYSVVTSRAAVLTQINSNGWELVSEPDKIEGVTATWYLRRPHFRPGARPDVYPTSSPVPAKPQAR